MRPRAMALPSFLWIARISPTCFSMVCSGFSDVSGSWKMIATRLPRMSRIREAGAPTISSPSSLIEPEG